MSTTLTTQTTQSLLPPVPQPPHDPTWWRLDGRAGWRASALEGVEVTPACCALALSPLASSLRSLDEASGSLGGLALPSNVARAADGSLFLLDAKAAELKRFDPCECRWAVVPCFGGTGMGPRQLKDAHGIGIHVAFSDHKHGVNFHLLGALDFAVDLVAAVVHFCADLLGA